MANPFKLIKAGIVEPLKYYYNFIYGFFSLNIEGIDPEDENALIVNDYFEKLYAVEIAGAGENVNFLPDHLIDTLISEYSDAPDGELVWVLLKDGILKKNLIFTHNKSMAQKISSSVSSRLLTFNELFDRILSLFFNNKYSIDSIKRELKQEIYVDFDDIYKSPVNTVNGLIKERIKLNYEKLKLYQAISYKYGLEKETKKFDIEQFFGMNFKGALYTRVTFNKKTMKIELENQILDTKFQLKDYEKNRIRALKQTIDDKKRAMLNSVLVVYDDFGSSVSALAGQAASCQFDQITRDARGLINKTPLFKRYRSFSRIVPADFLYNYISYNTKLDSDQPHICGLTIADTFANFGWIKATAKHSIPKQHTILLGTSGAGKTVTANYIFNQLVGYDYTKGIIHRPDETQHIVFDIKNSFYNQIKSIQKHNPDKVDMNDFDKNSFSYNIVDCDYEFSTGQKKVLESDLDFASILISLILAAGGKTADGLSEGESGEFKRALRELYEYGGYDTDPINSIEHSHPEDYARLISLGYKEYQLFEEVKEKEFDKFKKPLLHNVLNLLRQWRERYLLQKEKLKEEKLLQLLGKLETIDSQQIFSSHSRLNFQNKQIIYFKTDSLVGGNDYGYMVFAMQSILAKNIKKLQDERRVKKQKRPLVYFWYEEARNIFSNKLFREKEIFERVINEWRSYNMVFFPVTQEPQHIPDSILNGFEIKIILTSGEDEEEKDKLIDNLSKRLSIGDKRKALLRSLPKYTMLIMYGDGAFTFKFLSDPDFINLVDT